MVEDLTESRLELSAEMTAEMRAMLFAVGVLYSVNPEAQKRLKVLLEDGHHRPLLLAGLEDLPPQSQDAMHDAANEIFATILETARYLG